MMLLPNRTRRLLETGETVLGTAVGDCAAPEVVWALARAGFDFVVADIERGSVAAADIPRMCQAAAGTCIEVIARVPLSERLIADALDAGADGVLVPHIESIADAREVVELCRFRPLGRRRCLPGAEDDDQAPPAVFAEHCNANTLVMVQLETPAALAGANEIAALAGVDVILVEPAGIAAALGVPVERDQHELNDLLAGVIVTAAEAGKPAGTHWADAEYLAHWRERGMRCLVCSSELGLMADGAAAAVRRLRAGD